MSEKIFPTRKKSIITRNIVNECILYDPDVEMVHIINTTAKDIWNLCDGKHSLEKIALKLYAEYDVKMSVLQKDVQEIISNLKRTGLLSYSVKS